MASKTGKHKDAPLFGVSAEFASPHALLDAVKRLRAEKGHFDTHTPVPVPGLSEVMGRRGSIKGYSIVGVVLGFAAMMGLCIYTTAEAYVLNIGGRPLVSWQAFVVPSVSFAMLMGALVTMLAFLVTSRLPRLNHPAFNIPNITRATQDRYFLTISPTDAPLDLHAIERILQTLDEQPLTVARVRR